MYAPYYPDRAVCWGGVVSLTAVAEGYAGRAILAEKDASVAALWRVILGDHQWLNARIADFTPTHNSVAEILALPGCNDRIVAMQTIVRNRINYGGILARGASMIKAGENGKGLCSRWYPSTLLRRINDIADMADRIRMVEGDGFEVIFQNRRRKRAVFFIDPPYTIAGKRAGRRLYDHNNVDHERLFDLASSVNGRVIMTYDHSRDVLRMARERGLYAERISMKNGHHVRMTELVITK